jgi:hypothetical protein
MMENIRIMYDMKTIYKIAFILMVLIVILNYLMGAIKYI